jgi:hypothetical protein
LQGQLDAPILPEAGEKLGGEEGVAQRATSHSSSGVRGST